MEIRDSLEGVVPCLPSLVNDDVIPTVSLVDVNFALIAQEDILMSGMPRVLVWNVSNLFSHVIPVLGRVYASLQGCGPRRGINSCSLVLGATK